MVHVGDIKAVGFFVVVVRQLVTLHLKSGSTEYRPMKQCHTPPDSINPIGINAHLAYPEGLLLGGSDNINHHSGHHGYLFSEMRTVSMCVYSLHAVYFTQVLFHVTLDKDMVFIF